MRFKTIEDYNKDLEDMEENLREMEDYIEKHQDNGGTLGNYETYKYLYNIFKKDRIRFIENVNKINLQFDHDLEKGALTITEFYNLTTKFNKIRNLTGNLFGNDNPNEDLVINGIINSHYKITLSFKNPTEEDVKRDSARKKGLIKIFDLIQCGDDIEKLKKEVKFNTNEILMAYNEFLKEIIKHGRGFILDTEMETVKVGLTLEQCKNICKNLKVDFY